MRLVVATLILVLSSSFALSSVSASETERLREQFRRPIAIGLSKDGTRLFAANRDSGSISVVDLSAGETIAEIPIGKRLSDLAVSPDKSLLATIDKSESQLVILRDLPAGLCEVGRTPMSAAPISVRFGPEGNTCFVASLWSRRLTIVDLSDPAQPSISATVDLPFAPRAQNLLPDHRTLVVADSFGGELALIDVRSRRLIKTRSLAAHNIRALAVSADEKSLLIPHQILHAEEETTEGGVHWGGVMSNVVRRVSVDWLASDEPMPVRDVFFLGHPDRATGDPSGIAVTKGSRQIVTYAGLSEVAVSDVGANYYQSLAVGRRPTAVALNRDETFAYIANAFGDSISVVQIEPPRVVREISLGPRPNLDAAHRGELLFYDASLASDGWYSCHSCHTDGHSNGGRSDNLSDGSFGAPKRVLSLLGVGETGPWAWNGETKTLAEQVRKSIEITMRGPRPSQQQINDLVAYLHTLRPAPSLAESRGPHRAAMARGRIVFETHHCSDCHHDGVFTSEDVYDVGLRDEVGNSRFNPPSLRGVSQRRGLFHDNRGHSLRAVVTQYSHGVEGDLSSQQIDDLVEYLKSL
jgi:YVTN family beta-propeller protein